MRRPVRALFLNENIGGHATVHHHLRTIAESRSDIELRVIDIPPPGPLRKIAALEVPGLGRWDADLRPARYQLAQSAWVARRLRGWLADTDVVHVYTHNVALLSGRALRSVPYVITIDSTNEQSVRMQPARSPTRFTAASIALVKPLERRLYLHAQRVVANSEWAARSLHDVYGVPTERIAVIPMGVPVPPAAPAVAPRRLPRIVFIGRGMERKGGNQLLRVHQRFLSHRCELVLVTRDQVPNGLNVLVLNDVSPGDGQLDAVLAAGDLLALPSRLDQWPNAVLEAMAAGMAPVVSNVGGLPSMVQNGVTGMVLDDDSDATLQTTLTRLLDDPARTVSLGRAARAHVTAEMNVTSTANRLFDLVGQSADLGRRQH